MAGLALSGSLRAVDSAYRTKQSGDGEFMAVIVPENERQELWRGFYTLLQSHQGLPIAKTYRGDLLRKLGHALKEGAADG